MTKSSGLSVLDDRAVSKIREIRLPNVPDELRERAFSEHLEETKLRIELGLALFAQQEKRLQRFQTKRYHTREAEQTLACLRGLSRRYASWKL